VTLHCLPQLSGCDLLSFKGEVCLGKQAASFSASLSALRHVEVHQQSFAQALLERSVSTNALATTGSSDESSAPTMVNQNPTRQLALGSGSESSQASISELNLWATSRFRKDVVWEPMEENRPFFRAATTLGGRRFQGDWVNTIKGKSAAKASCLQKARAEMP